MFKDHIWRFVHVNSSLRLERIKICLLKTFTLKTSQGGKVSNYSATKSIIPGGAENSPPDQHWFPLTPQTPAPWRRPARGGWRAPPEEQRPSSVSS